MTIDVLEVAQVDELYLAMSGLGRVCYGKEWDLLRALTQVSTRLLNWWSLYLGVWWEASLGSLSTYPLL
jgi:hypothetical protein